MHLSGAVLFVNDLPGMRKFYGEMLQAAPVNHEGADSYAVFQLNGSTFVLHAIPTEHASETQSAPKLRDRNPVKMIFAVDDVAAERARLEALGISVLPRPWQNPAESCDAADPEGNIFQIAVRQK